MWRTSFSWPPIGMFVSRRMHDAPTICTFYGILIKMYWNDRAPPRFHVAYAEFCAV